MKILLPVICLVSITIMQCSLNSKEAQKEQTGERPNILFCIADDASYPLMGNGDFNWIRTSALDRIAASGIRFTNCYTPNAKCAPSRACILTGRNSWQLKEAANHNPFFPAEFKTITETLGDNGYYVGYSGKGWAPGDPGMKDGEPRDLIGRRYNELETETQSRYISAIDYSANFNAFLEDTGEDPWFFWYGGYEPHRPYEFQTGIEKGHKFLSAIDSVYRFWPDDDTIRTDLLDFAFEVEYFDKEILEILEILEKRGELDNTVVIVTADNGMPFPRIKGQAYELSNHMPLAIMWKEGIKKPGRTIDDMISFIDFAPTFAELAGIDWDKSEMHSSPGKSLINLFHSSKQGIVDPSRDYVLIGKERHDVGRPNDEGYPIRGIFKDGFLLLKNYKPDRWPAGNPETGYLNCDGSPTKTKILNIQRAGIEDDLWQLNFGKRPAVEFYNILEDPQCLINLAGNPTFVSKKDEMGKLMELKLKDQNDPRILGTGDVFDQYEYCVKEIADFYNRYTRGEEIEARWVNPSDFEKQPFSE